MPQPVVLDPRTASDTGQPEVEEARFAHAQHDADQMHDDRRDQRPHRLEDQEQLGREHRIGDEIAVRDAGEHLRPGQGDE